MARCTVDVRDRLNTQPALTEVIRTTATAPLISKIDGERFLHIENPLLQSGDNGHMAIILANSALPRFAKDCDV